jgi:hypothetical protein
MGFAMPEYFLALVSQYSGALNKSQAERYAKSVVDAWYYSSDNKTKTELLSLLPEYLRPQKKLFHNVLSPKVNLDQDDIFISRVMAELSKTDSNEAEQIIAGVFKSLKIISSQKSKFKYHSALNGRMIKKVFIEA